MQETRSNSRGAQPWLKTAAYLAALLVLLAAAGVMLFANLEEKYVEMHDEVRHALNAYEMVQSGDYLVNRYLGSPDYDTLKPPLTMWAIALSYRLFGFTLAAVRIPSAAAMFVMMAAIAVWMKRRYGSVASLLALGGLVAMNAIISGHYARYGDPDAIYQLCFTLSMLCMLDGRRDFRYFYGCALFFGLSFMAKSWHALCIPLIALAYLVANKQLRQLSLKRCGLLLAAGLAPVLPWAVARYLRDGWKFLLGGITTDVVQRVTDMPMGSRWEYPNFLFGQPVFIVCLVVAAVAYLLLRFVMAQRLDARHRATVIGCLLWMLIPPVIFSFSSFKMYHYVFGSLTAAALLMGVMVDALLRAPVDRRAHALRVVLTAGAAAVCVVGVAANVSSVLALENDHHYQVAMRETLNREDYAGVHVYIQYNEKDEQGERISKWQHDDMMMAMLYSDGECLPGGAEAFMEDEDAAIIFLGNLGQLEVRDELAGYAIPIYEERYITVFSNY